jgi:hypothetical protein
MKRLFSFLSAVWFPLALIGLFLLALPGLVLVILVLFDLDRELKINEFLEQNLSISYQLAVNPWIALVLLLLPLVILILYFLKLKRKPIQVPSTFLWKKSIEDVHVNTLFQWLRQNVLLVLQVLAVLFLIYSVLGLRIHGHTSHGRHYILMIDNSASMAATDVAPSRLEWARQEALKEIDAAGDEDYGMVIIFNSKATTLQAYTNNRVKLREAVRSIEQTSRPTRIDEALALAESLANPVRSTEDVASQPENVPNDQKRTFVPIREGEVTSVHLYSDGRYAKLSEATLASLNARLAGSTNVLGNLNLQYHRAGKPGAEQVDNVGIVNLSAVKYIEDPLKARKPGDLEAQQLLVTARVANYRPTRAEVKVRIDVYVDGQLFLPKQQTLTIEPRKVTPADDAAGKPEDDRPGERGMDVKLPPLDLGKHIVLHAYLDKHKDDFALDDEAWLAVGVLRKAKVLIVGPPNTVLEAFFDQEATEKLATVERLTPADLATEKYKKHARSGDIDLVIFDRCTPEDEADLPLANTYFIYEVPPPWLRGKSTYRPPVVIPSKGNHPLLRYLTTLSEMRVGEAFDFDVQKNLDPKAAKQPRPGEDKEVEKSEENGKQPPLTMTRILESNNQKPLLFSLVRGPYADVVQTFALVSDKGDLVTDWPLQPSFPLFFRNVLYILGKVDDAVRAAGVQPGEPMVLRPEAGVEELEVTPPGGSPVKLQRGSRPDFVFGDSDRLGVYKYQATGAGAYRSFAVNLLDGNESNIEPRDEIRIGSDHVVTGQERAQPQEIWKWILVLAVALLTMEWVIYNRRISV